MTKKTSPRPRIALLSTGGTIAGQTQAAGGYLPGVLAPQALLQAVPQLADLALVSAEMIASVGSANISTTLWIQLAQRISSLFERNETDGVVITHGTDTLEETAYFLSLVLPANRPVVLVGAMRPADALGADGPANLHHAVALAASAQAIGHGPLVVMNEQVYGARDVQKISASSITAFAAPNGGVLGQVWGDQVRIHVAPLSNRAPLFSIPDAGENLPRVDILYAHAGQPTDLIDAVLAQGARGLVLAGVGAGNAPDAVLTALRRVAERGIAVVRASRTGGGYVGRSGEIDDQACGFVTAGNLPPAKARILLMMALAQGMDFAALCQVFAQCG